MHYKSPTKISYFQIKTPRPKVRLKIIQISHRNLEFFHVIQLLQGQQSQ